MSTANGTLTPRQREILLICQGQPDKTANQLARNIRAHTGMALTSALNHVYALQRKGYLGNGQAPSGPSVYPTTPGDPNLLRELMAWLPGLSMYVKRDQEKRQDFLRRLAEAVKADEARRPEPAGA